MGTGSLLNARTARRLSTASYTSNVFSSSHPTGTTATRFGQHPRLTINANHRTGLADGVGQPAQVRARPAANVDHRLPRRQSESAEEPLLVGQAHRSASGGVHVRDLVRRGNRLGVLSHPSVHPTTKVRGIR
jgi:hypothetical protein